MAASSASLVSFMVTCSLLLLLVVGDDGHNKDVCSGTTFPENCTQCVLQTTMSPPGGSGTMVDAQDERAVAGALMRCAKASQAAILFQFLQLGSDNSSSGCVNATQSYGALIDEALQQWTKDSYRAAAETLLVAIVETPAVALVCIEGTHQDVNPLIPSLESLLVDGQQILVRLSSAASSSVQPFLFVFFCQILVMYLCF